MDKSTTLDVQPSAHLPERQRRRGRRAILDLVMASPGMTLTQLARALDIRRDLVRYHLKVLAQRNIIRLTHVPRSGRPWLVAFPSETTGEEEAIVIRRLCLDQDSRLKFLCERLEHGDQTRTEAIDLLRQEFGLSSRAAERIVMRGEALGLVRADRTLLETGQLQRSGLADQRPHR